MSVRSTKEEDDDNDRCKSVQPLPKFVLCNMHRLLVEHILYNMILHFMRELCDDMVLYMRVFHILQVIFDQF